MRSTTVPPNCAKLLSPNAHASTWALLFAPLLTHSNSRVQFRELYQMHVRSTTVPPNYAKLLQLRDMLELPAKDADALEAEVLGNGASFSI